MNRLTTGITVILTCLASTGCVQRILQVESAPPGASVHINGEAAGTTPLEHPFDFYGEFIDFDLNQVLTDLYELMQPINQLTSTKVSGEETTLISSLLTDPSIQDVALLAARSAASIDSLHEKEEAKYNYWFKAWGI